MKETPRPNSRMRADELVVQQGLAENRSKAKAMIMAGQVLCEDGRQVSKAGEQLSTETELRLRAGVTRFASRGGEKLAGALDAFALDVQGLDCIDVGASTGGFTDCLLQAGANSVVALDVGEGQLAWRLQQDPRVEVRDRTNIRHVTTEDFGRYFDLAVADLSFVGLSKVLPSIVPLVRTDGHFILLVKPQFEAGKEFVGKGGIVRDEEGHRRAQELVRTSLDDLGCTFHDVIPSPIKGRKGNTEFLVWAQRRAP